MYKKLTFCGALFPPSDGNLCLVKNINEDTNMILLTERKRHGKKTNRSAIITYIYILYSILHVRVQVHVYVK